MKSDFNVRYDSIKLLKLNKPLSIQAQVIRNAFENSEPFPCQYFSDSFRLAQPTIISPGSSILLNILFTPHDNHLFNCVNFNADFINDNNNNENSEYVDMQFYEYYNLINRLIKWKRDKNGSIVFIHNYCDISLNDIGLEISQDILIEFYEIIEEQSIKYHCQIEGMEGFTRTKK